MKRLSKWQKAGIAIELFGLIIMLILILAGKPVLDLLAWVFVAGLVITLLSSFLYLRKNNNLETVKQRTQKANDKQNMEATEDEHFTVEKEKALQSILKKIRNITISFGVLAVLNLILQFLYLFLKGTPLNSINWIKPIFGCVSIASLLGIIVLFVMFIKYKKDIKRIMCELT